MADINETNGSQKFFHEMAKLSYILGGSNYLYTPPQVPKFFIKIHDTFYRIADIAMSALVVSHWAAFFTQTKLNEKQRTDLILFSVGHPLLVLFAFIISYHKNVVKEVGDLLTVRLKEVYNNVEVEKQMIWKAKFYTSLMGTLATLVVVLYGIDSFSQILISNDATFVTLITAWPAFDDTTIKAGIARFIIYMLWLLFTFRMVSIYCIVIPVTVCLSHQYKNLCYYFRDLNSIFEENITQKEKEEKYEEGIKLGFKMHAETLRCTELLHKFTVFITGGMILFDMFTLVVLMYQMLVSEHTLTNTLTILTTAACLLTTTGCIVLTAGDITTEADELSQAMFQSGWHHCWGKTVTKVGTLLSIAMCMSQRPVLLKCFGVLELSYDSYLKIVKASYSFFSVFY